MKIFDQEFLESDVLCRLIQNISRAFGSRYHPDGCFFLTAEFARQVSSSTEETMSLAQLPISMRGAVDSAWRFQRRRCFPASRASGSQQWRWSSMVVAGGDQFLSSSVGSTSIPSASCPDPSRSPSSAHGFLMKSRGEMGKVLDFGGEDVENVHVVL